MKRRWLELALLCLGGGAIYLLPYMQYSYYGALAGELGLSHARMGALLSVYGLVNLPAYLMGGLLADRVPCRILVPLALAAAGLAGFWFASQPSFSELIAIHALWSVATVFVYWPAMIKAVKLLGSREEQGRLFGFRDAGFSAFAFLFTALGLGIFQASRERLASVIHFYSAVCLLLAALSYALLPREPATRPARGEPLFAGLRLVVREPRVWLIGLMMLCAYAITAGMGRLVPYLTNVFQVGAPLAALVGILRTYVIAYVASAGAGIAVDKVTTVDRYMSTIFVVLALLLGALVVLPGRPSTLALVLGVALAASLFVSSLRGVYWAPLQMANLPDRCLGTAVGLISVVGFLPDAFLFLVYGELLDRYAHAPATGFRLLFASLIGFAVVGAACARRFRRYSCPHAPARPRRAAGLVPRQPPAHARLVRDPGA